MGKYGFTELRPPSKLLHPGTMVWVQKQQPFQGGIVCTQQASLGREFVSLQSPTMSSRMAELNQSEFEVGAEFISVVQSDVHFQAISNMTMTFNNPQVYALTDTDVLHHLSARDPVCAEAIAKRREAGYHVTMVSQALLADVVYNVQFKESLGLTAKQRQQILQELSIKLGYAQQSATDSTISGKDLYWGISDDTYLAHLEPNAPHPAMMAHPGEGRLIPGSVFKLVDEPPDVP